MISNSQMLADKMKIQVPGMGDSITEGTIIEWTAQVGQAVKVDDVIALIETDKVTIDIKAQMDGVLVEHFANVDDEVEVGSDLYMIDTEGIASTSHVMDISNVFRDEEVMESVSHEEALRNAPGESEGGFSVPKID